MDRVLTATGQIITPFERENLPLVRSFPGARFNGNSYPKHWTVSLAMQDRPRVLELADRMGLNVDPSLRAVPEKTELDHGTPPAGRELFPFQHEGVKFLAGRSHALLGDSMGVGKTVQALLALPAKNLAPVLVIAPACVKLNWRREASIWRPDYRVTVCSGKGSVRVPQAGEILICNYDILPAEVPAGWSEAKVTVIADEAHMVKNYKAARSKKVLAIQKASARCWFLTGTPLLNRPFDLYGVLQANGLDSSVFPSFGSFLRAFNGERDRWGGFRFGRVEPYVAEKLRNVMLRRRKDEVLKDLPPKIHTVYDVNGLSASLRRELDEMWEESDVSARDASDELPPFEEFSKIRAKLAVEKIPALIELVEQYEESETPLVVFSAHREPVLTLGDREGWKCITGSTSPEDRQATVEAFQAGNLKGVALTIAAGGVGLTLTHASTMIFLDLDWTPALNEQAQDRIHRIGQSGQSCQYITLVADHPLERHLHALLTAKKSMINAAIDGPSLVGHIPTTAETASQSRQDRRSEYVAPAPVSAKDKAKSRVEGILCKERVKAKEELKEMTPERVAAVRAAFAGMLSVCDGARDRDGVGFSKPDAWTAHVVLATDLETEQELEAAYRMLLRYPRQNKKQYPILWK